MRTDLSFATDTFGYFLRGPQVAATSADNFAGIGPANTGSKEKHQQARAHNERLAAQEIVQIMHLHVGRHVGLNLAQLSVSS